MKQIAICTPQAIYSLTKLNKIGRAAPVLCQSQDLEEERLGSKLPDLSCAQEHEEIRNEKKKLKKKAASS